MKRQGDNTKDQPPIKKPDVSGVSTDLRSKIGAKLQTLLSGLKTDSRLSARNKRRLYADLFGETQHSEIIIDPTIVIKTEAPEVEECSNDSSTLTSQNFLVSAKSRLTELLSKQQEGTNKFKNNEKENTLSSKRNSSTPGKSTSLQNQASQKLLSRSSNSLNKKRKNSSCRGHSSSSSNATNSQVRLKDVVVLVEDVMNSKKRTKSLPTKRTDSHNSTNLGSSSLIEVERQVTAKGNLTNGIVNSVESNDEADVYIEGESTMSESVTDTQVFVPECCVSESNSEINVFESDSPTSSGSVLFNDYNSSKVISLADMLTDTEEGTSQIPYSNEDDSELVDDPGIPQVIVDITVGESLSTDSNTNSIVEATDPDVVLLCVKRPTHEVITLEDNDDSDDVVEEVHVCDQCGKAFRAKSLLNFHLRMHGTDSST